MRQEVKAQGKPDALSFKQLIDIIKTEYEEEQASDTGLGYAGGYKI